jgi:hypothetical protein
MLNPGGSKQSHGREPCQDPRRGPDRSDTLAPLQGAETAPDLQLDESWGSRDLDLAPYRAANRYAYFFFLGGTFAPDRRASLRPIAIACFRLLTFVFPPDLRVPCLYSRIVFATLLRPRTDDFLVEEPLLVADDRFFVLAMEMFSSAFFLPKCAALPALNRRAAGVPMLC